MEQGEEIVTEVVDWNTAMKMVENGEIHDAKTLVGLLLWIECAIYRTDLPSTQLQI